MFTPILKGVVIGAGLIIPIGAQNAYVLSQGIKKNYHLTAASICIFFDFLLMSLGVYGGGAMINANEWLYLIITWGGIIFLMGYGAIFVKNAVNANIESMKKEGKLSTRKKVIFTTLAVTLLNPHVYLDTVVIIGSISGNYAASEKAFFLVGTVIASLLWFYSLSLASARMAPWLNTVNVQRGINITVGLIMWAIAFSLLSSVIA